MRRDHLLRQRGKMRALHAHRAQPLGYYHEKFGTPATLAELGVEQDKLAEIASAVVREGNIMTNPKRIREQDVLEILQRSM